MSWYAYCLTEIPTLPSGARDRRPFFLDGILGVGSAPVMCYPSGEFAVIVSEYDHSTHELDEEAARQHARVVSRCFQTATVLPFRFGSIFDTDDALRQAVRVNRRTFGASVERLRAKPEMHIKVTVRDGSGRRSMEEVVLPDTVGGEYLAKLREKASRERERQTKSRALSVQVHQLFNPLEEELGRKRVNSGAHAAYSGYDRLRSIINGAQAGNPSTNSAGGPGEVLGQKEVSGSDRRLVLRYHRLIDRQLEGKLSQKDQKELRKVEKRLQEIEQDITSQGEQVHEERHRMMMEGLSQLIAELHELSSARASRSEPQFSSAVSSRSRRQADSDPLLWASAPLWAN